MLVYFLGIAGAGVSALASVLKTQGHDVRGSDEGVYPPVSTYLDRVGIPYASTFDVANLPEHVDVAVIGTTAKIDRETNPEYAELIRRGVPCHTFADYLGRGTAMRENLIVAGSFGKSSLTAMIADILRSSGKDPGWFIGAVPLDLPVTGHWGSDPLFVMEGDEYVVSLKDHRSKFELYHPRHILISSIVHDHINMFPTMAEYEAPFSRLIDAVPDGGSLICAHGFEPLRRMAAHRNPVWYGVEKCPGFYADNIQIGEITSFNLVTPWGLKIALETQLLGLHSIENIVGASAFLMSRALVTAEQLQAGVRKHRGVARRLDRKTTVSTIPVYEGFGSSYEKARSAIEAIQRHFAGKKISVVFEPHTFSWRNRDALEWYDTVFEGVDHVWLLAPPTHGAANHAQLTQNDIADRIRAAGAPVTPVITGGEVIKALPDTLKAGEDVLLLLSSGPLEGLSASLPVLMDTLFAP
jgi:UDP-N-acetylmuramate: L-alanyl-gamma-D-glutamyl-meso-diaminopimelate ligase